MVVNSLTRSRICSGIWRFDVLHRTNGAIKPFERSPQPNVKTETTMQIHKFMTTPVITGTGDMSIRETATLMRDHNIGLLPILCDGSPVGVLTDRDIVTRVLPIALDAGDVTASQAMSDHPMTCRADQDVTEAATIMGDHQLRRLLVVDHADQLVGILSLGDIAENVSEELAGQALGEIVEAR